MAEIDEKELVKFDQTEAELKTIVAETSGFVVVDINDKAQIEVIKKARISIGRVITAIEDFGLNKRSFFTEINKKIMARQKELVAILEPEKDRLKAFEDEYKQKKEIADRKATIPYRREELERIGYKDEVTDDFLCEFSGEQFVGFCNKFIADKNEADRIANQKRQDELDAKENELKHKDDIRLAEEKARAEEKEKADQREKDRIQKEIDDKKREDDRLAQEKEKLEKDKKYKAWLKKNNYGDGDGMLLVEKNGFVLLYQFVDKYEK